MEYGVTVKVKYERDIPTLIDCDGTVLSYAVINVTEFITGTIKEAAHRFNAIKAEHPGAGYEIVYSYLIADPEELL